MKIVLLIISLFFVTSCKVKQKTFDYNEAETLDIRNLPREQFDRNYTLYKISHNKFVGQDSIITTYYTNGKIQTKGKFARNRDGIVSSLKTDLFESYYENGNLKAIGKYDIGRYTQCCTGGLCSQFYNYKFGEWQYYFQNGNPKSKIVYEVKVFQIDTSCKDGDHVSFGQINLEESEFWNEIGQIIKPSVELIDELETVVFNQGEYHSESLSIQKGKVKLELIAKQK